MSLRYTCARSGRLAFPPRQSSMPRLSILCRCLGLPGRSLPRLSPSVTALNACCPCTSWFTLVSRQFSHSLLSRFPGVSLLFEHRAALVRDKKVVHVIRVLFLLCQNPFE